MSSEKVKDVSDDDFQAEVLDSAQPVLVDFWASWCAPCRMLAPTIDQLAEELNGQAKIVKLDVDSNMDTAAKYNVRGVPTLILFKDGDVKDHIVGAQSKDAIKRMILKQATQ